MSVRVANASGWQEVARHWSSLPISLWSLSSPLPRQLLYQAQGQAQTHKRSPDHPLPYQPSCCTPPKPKPTPPHLCSPAPALSFPRPSWDPAWQTVMNGTLLLLSTVGLILAHPLLSRQSSCVTMSGLKTYVTAQPCVWPTPDLFQSLPQWG